MNIEHRTSNIEWENLEKQTYDQEEGIVFLFDFKI